MPELLYFFAIGVFRELDNRRDSDAVNLDGVTIESIKTNLRKKDASIPKRSFSYN